MIRRGFWLLAGAMGGIMGYRRVASLGRRLSGPLVPGSVAAAPEAGAERADSADRRHARSAGTPRRQAAGRVLVRGTFRVTRDVRGFSRDVREGMDLYSARHPGRGGPTLGAGTDNERVKDDR